MNPVELLARAFCEEITREEMRRDILEGDKQFGGDFHKILGDRVEREWCVYVDEAEDFFRHLGEHGYAIRTKVNDAKTEAAPATHTETGKKLNMVWEYKMISCQKEEYSELHAAGAEGWELTGLYHYPWGAGRTMIAMFLKRLKMVDADEVKP